VIATSSADWCFPSPPIIAVEESVAMSYILSSPTVLQQSYASARAYEYFRVLQFDTRGDSAA